MENNKKTDDEKFQMAYVIMARVISDRGERYLPIFRRLHEEKELRNAERELKYIALQAARNGVG